MAGVLQSVSNSGNIAATAKRQVVILRKPSRPKEEMTRVPNPPPVAVARRNARERNRVKQVNNGFATLRQHIPTDIAATYESGSGRGSNKKLSKVETLRMAVEYIKSLEKLLSLSSTEDTPALLNNNSSSQQYVTVSSPSPVSSQFNLSYSYPTRSEIDAKSKKNYHLMYEDEENIHPLKMEDNILRESNIDDMSLLHSIDNNASLSPEVYSEHSMSPAGIDSSDTKSFIPVFNMPNHQGMLPSFSHLGYERLPSIKSELLSPNATQTVIDEDLRSTSEPQTFCVITRNDAVTVQNSDVIDVMWWEQQQQTS